MPTALLETRSEIEQLTNLLTESVRIATKKKDAVPRVGQLMLTKDIWASLVNRSRMAGVAPTGTGKSFSHLSCAALLAILFEERSVVSTSSLNLQAQFMDDDLPVVAQACLKLYDFELRFAVLKGVSNYADPVRALDLAQSLTGLKERSFSALVEMLDGGHYDKQWKPTNSFGTASSAKLLAELASWSLSVYLDDNEYGDRSSCPVEHRDEDWTLVSASSDEKADEKDTGYQPKADLAKERVLNAHIVVTNHTLLGMQAAQRIPIIFGSKRLGTFDHLIVDEAHSLPDQVRSRGAAEVSGRAVIRAGRAVMGVLDDRSIDEDSQLLAQEVDQAMKRAIANLPRFEEALRITGDDAGPVEDVLEPIMQFCGRYLKQLRRVQDTNTNDPALSQKCRRATSALERLAGAARDAVEPNPHIARWVSQQQAPYPPIFESSPISVGKLIESELWTVAPDIDLDAVTPEDDLEELMSKRQQLGVACVSATLPAAFHYDVNLYERAKIYPSPFDLAHASSAMFVPQCLAPGDIDAVKDQNSPKLRLNISRHEAWVVHRIIELVKANGGRALVLSAKKESGLKYAAALKRALPRINVHSQWDGGQVSRIISKWRGDETSVLVGTKGCMTGIDAKGETASLVIVDRPPRARKNVIDEARLEERMAASGGNRWIADQQTYVSDAALLLDQAIGRAIRSENDRALVAVLDPRLLDGQWSVFNYSPPVRHQFVQPLAKFGHKFNDLDAACAWIRERRERLDAA